MPHTSRKTRPPKQQQQQQQQQRARKRQLVDAGDGWTTVVSSSPAVAKAPTTPSSSTPAAHFEPASVAAGLTAEMLRADFARYSAAWQQSVCCAQLLAALGHMLAGAVVDRCVCLGLGSLADGRSRKVAMLQLAVLETVVGFLASLGAASTGDIPIYAQDPVFNALDAAFLSSHLITVLPTPAALPFLTPATFLFAPHCERSFLLPVLGCHDPVLVICNDIDASVTGVMSGLVGEREKEIAMEFLRGRTGWSVPVWKGMEGVVNDLCIYLRSQGEVEGLVCRVVAN